MFRTDHAPAQWRLQAEKENFRQVRLRSFKFLIICAHLSAYFEIDRWPNDVKMFNLRTNKQSDHGTQRNGLLCVKGLEGLLNLAKMEVRIVNKYKRFIAAVNCYI